MTIKIDEQTVSSVYIEGKKVQKIYVDGDLVWEAEVTEGESDVIE